MKLLSIGTTGNPWGERVVPTARLRRQRSVSGRSSDSPTYVADGLGLVGSLEDLVGVTGLDQDAVVEERRGLGHTTGLGEIVGDDHDGELLGQTPEQLLHHLGG